MRSDDRFVLKNWDLLCRISRCFSQLYDPTRAVGMPYPVPMCIGGLNADWCVQSDAVPGARCPLTQNHVWLIRFPRSGVELIMVKYDINPRDTVWDLSACKIVDDECKPPKNFDIVFFFSPPALLRSSWLCVRAHSSPERGELLLNPL